MTTCEQETRKMLVIEGTARDLLSDEEQTRICEMGINFIPLPDSQDSATTFFIVSPVRDLSIRAEESIRAAMSRVNPPERVCFTRGMVAALKEAGFDIVKDLEDTLWQMQSGWASNLINR